MTARAFAPTKTIATELRSSGGPASLFVLAQGMVRTTDSERLEWARAPACPHEFVLSLVLALEVASASLRTAP